MKIFSRIFQAIMDSRQLQAERIIRDSAYFAQQAREYELQLSSKKTNTVAADKAQTAGSFSMPIRSLAAH